jgi:hypothetical protein
MQYYYYFFKLLILEVVPVVVGLLETEVTAFEADAGALSNVADFRS